MEKLDYTLLRRHIEQINLIYTTFNTNKLDYTNKVSKFVAF